jgi:hypothetical protein
LPYEFNQGFERAWRHNKDLVGGNFPAEKDDWGFRDGSPITKLFTKNGQLEWYTLADGKQHILFTDLREGRRDRYVLQDPPSNKLVRLWSPGRQDPDTGQALDGDTPSSGHETPPPPAVVVPPPPTSSGPPNSVKISDFSGGKTLGRNSQADVDAFYRAVEAAQKLSGFRIVFYDIPGQFRFEPFDANGKNLGIVGLSSSNVELHRTPGRPHGLLKNFQLLQDFRLEGYSRTVGFEYQSEIELSGVQQKVLRVVLHDFGYLGITCRGQDAVIDGCKFLATSPGGDISRNENKAGHFGIWSEEVWQNSRSRGTKILNSYFVGHGLNAMFLAGQDERIENCIIEGNHRAHNPEGFGGGELCIAGVSTTIIGNRVGPSSYRASGIELDGNNHTVTKNLVGGHPNGTGIVCQRGKHHVFDNDLADERTAISVERESRDSVVENNRFVNCQEGLMRR